MEEENVKKKKITLKLITHLFACLVPVELFLLDLLDPPLSSTSLFEGSFLNGSLLAFKREKEIRLIFK